MTMNRKLFHPSLDNMKLGVPMTLCLFSACMALMDVVAFATGTLIPAAVGTVLMEVLKVALIFSFFGPLLVCGLFGARILKRMKNVGWLTGFVAGIPVAVLVSFATGFVERLNRTQAWLDEDLMFRICRMLSTSVIPICALIGYVWFAIKRRCQKPSPCGEGG